MFAGLCLDANGGKPGADVKLYQCHVASDRDLANQQWTIDGKLIRNKGTHQCLAAKDVAHHIHLTVDPPTQEAEGSFDFEVGVEMTTDESKKFNAAATLGITKVLVGAVLSLAYLW